MELIRDGVTELDQEALRALVHKKLRDGTLSRDPGKLCSVRPGSACTACGGAQPTVGVLHARGAAYLHVMCYRIWDAERRTR